MLTPNYGCVGATDKFTFQHHRKLYQEYHQSSDAKERLTHVGLSLSIAPTLHHDGRQMED